MQLILYLWFTLLSISFASSGKPTTSTASTTSVTPSIYPPISFGKPTTSTASTTSVPPSSQPPVSYSISEFFNSVASHEHLFHQASVKSLELRKSKSWLHWRHEFIVLAVTHGGQEYLIHLNRGWAGTGWWEYIPYFTWGSTKRANDSVSVFLSGDQEESEREGTELIALINFHAGVPLQEVTTRLASTVEQTGPYSLLGMNCWAWSRYLTLDIIRGWKGFVQSVQIPRRGGQVDVASLLRELASDPWATWGRSAVHKTQGPSLTRRLFHDVDLPSLYFYHIFFPDALVPWDSSLFIRDLRLDITSGGAFDVQGMPIDEAPHFFVHPWAGDNSNIPYSNSLCSPGDFLYLLTPPIPVDSEYGHEISVYMSATRLDHASRTYPQDSCVWFETAIVRLDPTNNTLYVSNERSKLGEHRIRNSPLYHSEFRRHFSPQQVQNGDMIGIWARAQCAGERNAVLYASISIDIDEFN